MALSLMLFLLAGLLSGCIEPSAPPAQPSGCGNGNCEAGETPQNCPEDCQEECTAEGESMPVYPGNKCCPGLVAISPTTPEQGCEPLEWAVICSNCGNGTCEEWENYCNCPQDCEAPPEDAIELVRNWRVEGSWVKSEVQAGSYEPFFEESSGEPEVKNIAIVVLENNEIICKQVVMPGIEPKAEYVFAFFELGKQQRAFVKGLDPIEEIFFEDSTLLVFTKCGNTLPGFINSIVGELKEMQDTALPEEHINYLKTVSLPPAWERTEQEFVFFVSPYMDERKNPFNISFKNPDIICKATIMKPDPQGFFTFSFYRNGYSPYAVIFGLGPSGSVELEKHKILVYSECGSDLAEFIQELIDELESIG